MNGERRIYGYALLALLIWSTLLGGLLWYNLEEARNHVDELARKEARASFNKDQAFRMWATQHGGVYVPISERTPPNPALAHVPERDLTTPAGEQLTLMNPAYMLRQIMEDFGALYGIKGKITSTKLMNPINAPDGWELAAIQQFEKGVSEIFEYSEINGEPYLRLMGAMVVLPGCLKCHGEQGYQVGDIRGGVGVSIPMQGYFADLKVVVVQQVVTFGVLWLIGVVGILLLTLLAQLRRRERRLRGEERERYYREIERANAELIQFANISAHHLMEPSRRLLLFARRLQERSEGIANDEESRLALEYIQQGATRMRDLVRDIERYLASALPRGEVRAHDPAPLLAKLQHHLLTGEGHPQGAQIIVESLPPLCLDLPRMSDLFAVLISNSLIHATSEQQPLVRIRGESLPDRVRVRIEDNGPGIPAEYRERVFKVFEHLGANPLAGTGVGLSIARRIVESSNGQIWIERSPLGGIAVVFEIEKGEGGRVKF